MTCWWKQSSLQHGCANQTYFTERVPERSSCASWQNSDWCHNKQENVDNSTQFQIALSHAVVEDTQRRGWLIDTRTIDSVTLHLGCGVPPRTPTPLSHQRIRADFIFLLFRLGRQMSACFLMWETPPEHVYAEWFHQKLSTRSTWQVANEEM